MNVELEAWSRCGNTDYFRRQWGMLPLPHAWFYVNPLNWTFINCWPQDPRGERAGLTAVIYQKAERYDWDTLKHGARMLHDDDDDYKNILRATHEWARDLLKAKDLKLSPAELRRLFRSAPEETKALVLEGVRALLTGYEGLALKENRPTPAESRAILIVEKGSPADVALEQITEEFHDLKHAVLTRNPDMAFEAALAEFGILEC